MPIIMRMDAKVNHLACDKENRDVAGRVPVPVAMFMLEAFKVYARRRDVPCGGSCSLWWQ